MAKNLPLKYQGFPLAGNVRLELPAQNARLQKQREFLQQRRGGKEKSASYWGLSEIHRRLFHIVPTAPAPDGGDFLPPIAVTGSWPHTHSISLLFGKSIQKPDNIRLADKNKRRGLPEIRQEGKKWKKLCRIFAEMQKRTSILPRKT